MHSDLPSPREAGFLLGGEARGNRVSCPGPGHGKHDRSLSIKFTHNAPDGFLVHSFAGDDPLDCRDYVRERLARISHAKECIGAPNQRKFFCEKDFPEIRGRPDDDRL
jgi:hypothetical protein